MRKKLDRRSHFGAFVLISPATFSTSESRPDGPRQRPFWMGVSPLRSVKSYMNCSLKVVNRDGTLLVQGPKWPSP